MSLTLFFPSAILSILLLIDGIQDVAAAVIGQPRISGTRRALEGRRRTIDPRTWVRRRSR